MAISQEQLLAFAVYEIRLLLADHLGSQSDSPMPVRAAAHLAHALHNEALAVLQGQAVDVHAAAARLDAVDNMLVTDFRSRINQALGYSA
jgi:hypothetical protein